MNATELSKIDAPAGFTFGAPSWDPDNTSPDVAEWTCVHGDAEAGIGTRVSISLVCARPYVDVVGLSGKGGQTRDAADAASAVALAGRVVVNLEAGRRPFAAA